MKVREDDISEDLDSGEREGSHITAYITTATTTTVYTPTTGKRIRLRWIYALNYPASTNPSRIQIKIGGTTYYDTYGISKRQRITGAVDAPLTVVTDQNTPVTVTAIFDEV